MLRHRGTWVALLAATVAIAALTAGASPGEPLAPVAAYPDLRAIVPAHLNLVNEQQREILRFSNGIANTGPGPWVIRAEHELGSEPTTIGFQQIRDNNAQFPCGLQPKGETACHTVISEHQASTFEYHPTHHHWHTANAALFEVRQGSPTGTLVAGNTRKVGFCLVEVYKLDDNAPTSERVFFDCFGRFQGAQSGWADQYHHATDGQAVDLTGIPARDDYYLVTTTDPNHQFLETDDTNNTEWVRFKLGTGSKGNRKVTVTAHSPCESPSMCGEDVPNRG